MNQFVLDFEKPIRELEARIAELRDQSKPEDAMVAKEIKKLEAQVVRLRAQIYAKLTRWHCAGSRPLPGQERSPPRREDGTGCGPPCSRTSPSCPD